jgi:phosphoglycolate phosphatase
MDKYKVVLFDLDGTLTDPKIGITKCVQYALEKMGILLSELDELEPFIGPPLQESFSRIYSFDEEQTKWAIEYYRERFLSRKKGCLKMNCIQGLLSFWYILKSIKRIWL